MSKEKIGLLVMAYGTPYKEEDIEPYYTHIRHGRKPSAEALQDLTERYQAIGGISPLARITEEQATAIKDKLNEMQNEYEFELFIGLKHINPFIEAAVECIDKAGIIQAFSCVISTHYTNFRVKAYKARTQETAATYAITLTSVEEWYNAPGFIQYWSDQISDTYVKMTVHERYNAVLIVSAHSLPGK